MVSKKKTPALFIGHGSPMNAISNSEFTRTLSHLGHRLPKPKAILVISSHWLTKGTFVTCNEHPKTIHDFLNFPDELYSLQYPACGNPKLAKQLADSSKGSIFCSPDWGLDHAAWSMLRHIYPKADVPVLELSLNVEKPPEYHYKLASKLAPFRKEGVMIIGTGNMVHNLWHMRRDSHAPPYRWAKHFDEVLREKLLKCKHKDLVNYSRLGEASTLAIPNKDHYLPMLYILGLQEKGEKLEFVYEGIQNGSVSMRSFMIS